MTDTLFIPPKPLPADLAEEAHTLGRHGFDLAAIAARLRVTENAIYNALANYRGVLREGLPR